MLVTAFARRIVDSRASIAPNLAVHGAQPGVQHGAWPRARINE
jgi:hypothetical protein